MEREAPDAAKRTLEPRHVLRWAGRITMLVGLAGFAYLWRRFDTFVLPGPCSPVVRLASGTRLVVDRRPPEYRSGDVVFFEGPAGVILLGELEREREDGAVWIATDAPDCPGIASERLGWIPRDLLRGRVVLASGWW